MEMPVEEWSNFLINDFEKTVFAAHTVLNDIKQKLYGMGAVYASMTGTGSSVYGLFSSEIKLTEYIFKNEYFVKEILL